MLAIDRLSAIPLHIECWFNALNIGAGTGFCVMHAGSHYLITNWHVVSGLNPDTGQPHRSDGATPNAIVVWHHTANCLGHWTSIRYPLSDANGAVWKEHASGRAIDIAAVPLTESPTITIYPLDLALANTDMIISPSEPVSIIGFPLGMAVDGKLPIWKTGHVASDIDVDYAGKPAFLIDATTTSGMSGSPVIARRIGAYRSSTAAVMVTSGVADRFMGVYSGRIHRDSDVGVVWRPSALIEVLARASAVAGRR